MLHPSHAASEEIADVLIMLAQVEIRLREMPLQDESSLWDQVEDILRTIMLAQVEIRLREMPLQDGSSLWDQVEDILQTKLQRLQERLEEDA